MGINSHIKFYASALLTIFFVVGCATPYAGPGPNLSATGDAARKEIEKFSFKEPGFFRQGWAIQMGPDSTRYTVESVETFVPKVSPSAAEIITSAKNYRLATRVALGVGDIALLIAIFSTDSQTRQILFPVGFISLGAGIGFSIKAFSDLSSATEQYNKDLRQKLSPTVGFNYKY